MKLFIKFEIGLADNDYGNDVERTSTHAVGFQAWDEEDLYYLEEKGNDKRFNWGCFGRAARFLFSNK